MKTSIGYSVLLPVSSYRLIFPGQLQVREQCTDHHDQRRKQHQVKCCFFYRTFSCFAGGDDNKIPESPTQVKCANQKIGPFCPNSWRQCKCQEEKDHQKMEIRWLSIISSLRADAGYRNIPGFNNHPGHKRNNCQ